MSRTAGAGQLEATSSEDDYTFSTSVNTAAGLDLWDCDSSLSSSVNYALVDDQGQHLRSGNLSCSDGVQLRDVPAGDYKVAITDNSHKGTYKLRIVAEAPQVFSASLPVDVSNGSPSTGAGNIEYPASEDVYAFSTAEAGTLQLDFSSCTTGWGWIHYTLTKVSDGSSVDGRWTCGARTVPDLAAGDYRLSVTDSYGAGTYMLDISAGSGG